MRQGRIGATEATAMLTLVLIAPVFLTFPRLVVSEGLTGAWLLTPMMGLVAALPLACLVALCSRFPGQSWGQICEAVLGRYLGKLPVAGIWLFSTVSTALLQREFSGAFATAILPRTPLTVTLVIVTVASIWVVMLGIETCARISVLFTLPIGVLAAVMFVSAVQSVRPALYLPALGPGLGKLLRAALIGAADFSELVLLAYLNLWLRRSQDLRRVGWLGALFGLVFMEMSIFTTLGAFGVLGTRRIVVPLLEIARTSTFAAFINNFEAMFVFLWVFVAGLRGAIGFYLATLSFAELFGLENLRALAIPVGFLIFNLALVPVSLFNAISWQSILLRPYQGLLTLVPPVLILLVAVVRRKRGAAG